MWALSFWKQTAERAIKTAAQVALSFFVVGQTGVLDVDWQQFASVTAVAGIASVLTSMVSSGVNDPENPSAVRVTNDEV